MQHQNLNKIKSLTLQLGGSAGNLIKKITSGFEFLNPAGTTLVKLRAAHADGSDQNQVAVQGNVWDAVARIDFAFAGATPPSAGDNTELYGLVHTSGGIYAAGDLVYDDGTTLRLITIVNHVIATTTAITGGTVELDESSTYANASSVAPYGWYKIGDALGSTAGVVRDLTMSVTTGASTDSTQTVPTGSDAPVLDVIIATGYNNAAVLTFSIGALVLGTIDGVDSAVTGRYIFTPDDWDVTAGDVLNVTVSNTPTAGALTAKLTWTKDQSA